MKFSSLLLILLFVMKVGVAQDTTVHINKKRLNRFIVGSSVAYGTSLVVLNHLWYKDSKQQSFQFFNDNAEWKQVDKLGHFFSAFYLSAATSSVLQHCDVPARKSDLAAAITGFAVLVPIEIFDGFSDAYGASTGDLLADAGGALFYLGQKRLWNEVRLHPKFSFQRTSYAAQRPNVLGDGLASELLKDYNGQTYWLSVDMDKFMPFPKWLNLACGYGAQGMIYARDRQQVEAGLSLPHRQYYLGIDPDLTAIRTRSRMLKTVLWVANMVKLPAPALEFSSNGTRFHLFAF